MGPPPSILKNDYKWRMPTLPVYSKNKNMTTDQIVHNQVQREYYESRTMDENWRMSPKLSPYIQNHVNCFSEFAQITPEEKVLDVGCGMGKFTLPLAEQGLQIDGLDLSPRLLETLLEHGGERMNIKTICADLLNPPSDLYGKYDTITGFFMLHHLIDVDASFVQMHKILQDKGRVLFLDVNPACPLYYLQIFLSPTMRWKAEKGIVNLTSTKLKRGLSAAGFSDVKIERYGILPPVLRNRKAFVWIDDVFNKLTFLRRFAAFQLISAQKG